LLDTHSRALLLESLRPPDGYTLDHAVGTTFSLDLMALLAAPLAFTFFDWEDQAGRPTADPLALLEALRRNVQRLTVFCQVGQIAVPPKDRPLLGYVEDSVFEVALDGGGVFHPKVWLLRFVAESEPVHYRFMCLSRNLTFDRSWDTALILEGEVADRKTAIARNHPLGDFLAWLPELAKPIRALPEDRAHVISLMQDEVRRVKFEPPEGFEDFTFWPLASAFSPRWPFPDSKSPALVMSPFLSDQALWDFAEGRERCVLVSRLEALQAVSNTTLGLFKDVYAMSPDLDEAVSAEETDNPATAEADSPSGLHAKLFIVEEGWDARVWTGSANATTGALKANVEFLVELLGKKSQCGIEALLAERSDKTGLRDLLIPFKRDREGEPEDPVKLALDRDLQEARNLLALSGLKVSIARAKDNQTFALSVDRAPEAPALPDQFSTKVWPITLDESAAVPLASTSPAASFPSVSWQSLTSFFAFEVEATRSEQNAKTRFVLNLPLEGAPSDRQDRLLRSILTDTPAVVRFLLMLLSEGLTGAPEALEVERTAMDPGMGRTYGMAEGTLFETLLRSLARDSSRLESVGRFVADLRGSEEGRALLPDEFDEIFNPIWEAYGKVKNGQ
jgi:hypothetical protein